VPTVLAWVLLIGITASIAVATSFSRHAAAPAAIGGLAAALAAFMLSLRCRPLASPALRSLPLGFARAWLRLLRLPLLLSGLVFVLPAGAAVAAEPAAWMAPVHAGLGLLLLNAIYTVFAAYFLMAPLVAALGFFAALLYAEYQSVEFGRAVYLGLFLLVGWLWYRARRRYYRG
jgi:hypothetical protein